MIEEITATLETSKPKRPFGVLVFTIYPLLFSGIIPVVIANWMLITGTNPELTLSYIFALVLDPGIIIASILTWKGNNKARILLLVLVSIHYLSNGYGNYVYIKSGLVSDDDLIRIWGRVFRGVIFPLIYIVYFTQAKTREYFKP